MVEILMSSQNVYYFDGTEQAFAAYVRSSNARGGNTLQVYKDKEKTQSVYINLHRVESFKGI